MLKLAIFFVLGGIFVATSHLSKNYSYWFDELFSIDLSSYDLAALHYQILLDVHPPLYPFILKYWLLLFGSTESDTRAFSWLCAMLSLYLFWRYSKKFGPFFSSCSVVFFSSNLLFIFYANEARAYSLALLLSTLLLTSFPFKQTKAVSPIFLISCLLLSLTHYFGLVLVGMVIVFCLANNRGHLITSLKFFVTGVCCLLWPLHHMTNGRLLRLAGTQSWIKPHTTAEVLDLAVAGFFPGASHFGFISLGIVVYLGCILALCLLAMRRVATKSDYATDDTTLVLIKALILLLMVVSGIVLIDQHTPIAMSRNFIVLLPLVAIIFGGLANLIAQQSIKYKYLVLSLVYIFSASSLVSAYRAIEVKASAFQDWKGAASSLSEQTLSRNIYVTHPLANFYLKESSVHVSPFNPAEHYVVGVTELRKPASLIYGQLSPEDRGLLFEAMRQLKARHIFPDHETSKDVGVFLID